MTKGQLQVTNDQLEKKCLFITCNIISFNTDSNNSEKIGTTLSKQQEYAYKANSSKTEVSIKYNESSYWSFLFPPESKWRTNWFDNLETILSVSLIVIVNGVNLQYLTP